MIKIAIIVGTRPEAIKLIPVYKALLSKAECTVQLISTGQHEELLYPVWELFELIPDTTLNSLKNSQGLSELTATLTIQLNKLFLIQSFDCIVVQGDTTTAMVASLVGFYHKIQIAHVEAGLRTGSKHSPFPEEVNRKIIATIADYNFAPTNKAKENLKIENNQGKTYVTGNTGIDSLAIILKKTETEIKKFTSRFKEQLNGYHDIVLVTGHRRENLGNKFDAVFDALVTLAKKYPSISYVYPVHLNPAVRIQVNAKLKGISNIHLIEPVRYDEMVFLLNTSRLVMTDSGGIQEECPFLNKPILVLRDTTERPEALEAGCSMLAGETDTQIINSFEKVMFNPGVYEKMSLAKNPYGDGNSGAIISDILIKNLSE